MAPSPTGNLHLGTAYATLWPYLFARRNQGQFILRIEDTDTARSTKDFEANIFNGLKWLGFSWDEGPYHQMDRLPNYQKAVDQLLSDDKAYYCFCTPDELDKERQDQAAKKVAQVYSGKCRNLSKDQLEEFKNGSKPYVIRFKMPDDRGLIKFKDLIHDEISFDSKLIGDTVIQRGTGIPLYNFAVVVDDIEMKISHVLRGDDHISNTPKQIVLFEALGATLPLFAHYPMILNSDRIGKLSKRDNSTSVDDYRKEGYLPEAIVNYLAILGWTMPDDREIMTIKEMEAFFDLSKMRPSAAAFDLNKLEWINGEYIRAMSDLDLGKRLLAFLVDPHFSEDKVVKLVPLVKERIKKLSDFVALTDFIFDAPEYDLSVFKKLNVEKAGRTKEVLAAIKQAAEKLSKPWTAPVFEETFRKLSEELSIQVGDMFQILRVAISGQLVTPPLFESIEILGQEEALKRIQNVSSTYPNFPDSSADFSMKELAEIK